MRLSNTASTAALAVVSAAVLLAVGCKDGGGSSAELGGEGSYHGPGSYNTVDLNDDGTFLITISEEPGAKVDLEVEGDFTRRASGFVELEVTDAKGRHAPDAGERAIALEVPGFAFLLKPLDEGGEIMPMVVAGECPNTTFTANWLVTSCSNADVACDATRTDLEFLGEFGYAEDTQTASLPSAYALHDGSAQSTHDIGSASCDDGIMEVDDARLFLTESGGAIVQISPDDDDEEHHVVALPQEAIVAADLAGDYAGLVFDGSADESFPVNMTVAAGGMSATAYRVDPEHLGRAVSGASVATLTFSSVNDVSGSGVDGFLTGTFTDGLSPATPLYCAAATDVVDSGKNVLLCIGQSPGDTTKHFNTVMVSKN
ncbi:MAG: hypothetical protein GY944_28895 [bacterium]|nr:hypothetical protein [bacterium]